ncbi:MAG: beta-lactamase family protein [Clostridiales bacterium]|nr:beta-lactamase family protein [Clostridiales bacterium]
MREEQLRKLMGETMTEYRLPSLSISMMAKGEELHLALGKANLEADIPATPDSIYCIASSTKSITATAVNLLFSEKDLSIDEPINRFLTWFRMYDDYTTKNLTVRDVLCHRCGLPRHELSWYNTPEKSTRQLTESLAFLPPAFPLRYRMCYQNHMYILATTLIEEVSGNVWGDYVKNKIFQPLDMRSTFIYGDEIEDGNRMKCRPYNLVNGQNVLLPYRYTKSVGGGGTVYSTSRDMLKWLHFNLKGDDAILKRELIEEHHTPHTIVRKGDMGSIHFPEMDFTSYGLGWFIESYRGIKVIHHGGTIDGFKSMQMFLPDHDICISALSNQNNTQAVCSVAYKIIDASLGMETTDWDKKYQETYINMVDACRNKVGEALSKINVVQWNDFNKYIGIYSHPAYGELYVHRVKDTLMIDAFGETFPVISTSDMDFIFEGGNLGIFAEGKAIMEGTGQVNALNVKLEDMLPETYFRFERNPTGDLQHE